MKKFAYLFIGFFCVFGQNICYCQHIPLGITRNELPEYVQKIGGGIITYPPPGIHEYNPEYTDSTVMGADSVKMFGYKGRLGFTENKTGIIYSIDLSIRNVTKSDYEKISKSFAKEFHLRLKKSKMSNTTYGISWADLKNNQSLTHADIIFFPWESRVAVIYTNKIYY